VSNVHLYRLGKRRGLGERMVATKFEPHDNWLPPGYRVPPELEQAIIESGVPEAHWNLAELPDFTTLGAEEIRAVVREKSAAILGQSVAEDGANKEAAVRTTKEIDLPCFLPYNLLTQHSIPDKSVADCVEALIGAYLTACGMRGALLFMSWLGLRVLPSLTTTTRSKSPKLLNLVIVFLCN
jgi:endoribonuclease Dicer